MTINESNWEMFEAIHREIDPPVQTYEESPAPRYTRRHTSVRPDYVPWVAKSAVRKSGATIELAKPGEIRLYEFYKSEAKRLGVSVSAIASQKAYGNYDKCISIRAITGKCRFVKIIGELPTRPEPEAGEIRLKDWLNAKSREIGLTPNGVFMQLKRGAIKVSRIRKASRYTVFITP